MNPSSRVLVIDDDLAVRLRIGDLLAQSGDFEFHEAIDGPSGLATALALTPDLILLDIMMPGMTGYEVCRALRASPRTREIPVIVLSAVGETEDMIAALDAGADDFLAKPFSAAELRAKIRTITKLNRYRRLVAERDRFQWLIDHSREPLVVADGRGALVYANASARETFALGAAPGVDVATAIGRNFHPEPADAWAAWRELRLPAGESFAIFRPESPQQPARWFEVELHALDCDASQTLLKFTDRTNTVRREVEAFSFQHLIAHKICTPLNGLTPVLAFLSSTELGHRDSSTSELFHLARESADRLQATLLRILDYHSTLLAPRDRSRADQPRPLSAVVTATAEAAGLRPRLELGDAANLPVQTAALDVALGEVLDNYAKFSDARTAGVQVRARINGPRLELGLFAPGPGLPPDVLVQLGRPYAQLEKHFTGEVPGMGVGLAIVRLLLRSVGGDVVFSNHPEASGLVTTLHLPVSSCQIATGHASQPGNS